jgi:chorismate dehydratase
VRPVRLGAVGYLNARPLVHGLDRDDRFDVRFDVPSTCAALLHEGAVDLGLIPSIEYLADAAYRVVPGLAIASRGAVASVALFARRPIREIRTIALDASSRTSAALLRILCARRFGLEPRFVTVAPDLEAMTRQCDAALLIGDLALYADAPAMGLEKVDLGAEWTAFTGLPFVWAFWVGREEAIAPEIVTALQAARDRGVEAIDTIVRDYWSDQPERVGAGVRYLRENIGFSLGSAEEAAIQRFYGLAAELGIVGAAAPVQFF